MTCPVPRATSAMRTDDETCYRALAARDARFDDGAIHMAMMDRAELRTGWTVWTRWVLLGPEDGWGARLATVKHG